MPNILLAYPKFPFSYWGFQFAMDFVGRKACMPPLGLVTVAGMFPNETYKLRVVDMNVETLSDTHLSWADGGYEENYLLNAVRKIQEQGLEVAAGFILGADGDTEVSFDAHIATSHPAHKQRRRNRMAQSAPITTLFVDIGNVLLTDSWGPAMRQKALERFGFDMAEVADRSRLTFEGYEEGKISLEDYLHWVVFYQERAFSRKALTDFMLAQSQPHPDMCDLLRALKARYGLKIVVVTNDGREFAVYRIRQFGLAEFVDFFVVSCFVRCRKPELEIYRMALDLSQVHPTQVVYIDDQALFVEVAQQLGMQGIHHTDTASTRAALAKLGLAL